LEELHIGGDPVEIVVLPQVGARLHRLRAYGHDLLRTPADPRTHTDDPYFWGAYVMAPWCNRIAPGPVEVEGRTIDLPPTFPDGSAIHGQVSSRAWSVDPDGTLRVEGGGDGWPWAYEVVARLHVSDDTVSLEYELINRSDGLMPAGIGFHPWFRRPVELRIEASTAYPSNSGSPTIAVPVREELDLRTLRRPPADLDGSWVDVTPPAATLAWPDVGLRATIEMESARRPCVAVATPAVLDAIAVEPQTHGPDGVRRLLNGEPDALGRLAPGEVLRLALRITVERVSLPG
jgi:aldose 1-epimerase